MNKFIALIILVISFIIGIIFLSTEMYHEKNMDSKQVEHFFINTTEVLDKSGSLAVNGSARSANNINFDKTLIRPLSMFSKEINNLRYKKWEALMFTSKSFIFLFSPFDLGYMGGFLLHYCDLSQENSEIEFDWNINFLERFDITDSCVKNCFLYDYEIKKEKSINSGKLYKTDLNNKHVQI